MKVVNLALCVMYLTCVILGLVLRIASILVMISVGLGDPSLHLVWQLPHT